MISVYKMKSDRLALCWPESHSVLGTKFLQLCHYTVTYAGYTYGKETQKETLNCGSYNHLFYKAKHGHGMSKIDELK